MATARQNPLLIGPAGLPGRQGPPGVGTPGATGPQGPAGTPGTGGGTTNTVGAFNMPAVGSPLNRTFTSTVAMFAGAFFTIPSYGSFQVSSVVDGTHAIIINIGLAGNVSPGTSIPNSSVVSIAGLKNTVAVPLEGQVSQIIGGAPTFVGHRPYINALSYGADPTGAIDSTAALQAAIDAAGANGTVYVPAGTYYLSYFLKHRHAGARFIGESGVPFGTSGSVTQFKHTTSFSGATVLPYAGDWMGPMHFVGPDTFDTTVPIATVGAFTYASWSTTRNYLNLSQTQLGSINGLNAFCIEFRIIVASVLVANTIAYCGGKPSVNGTRTAALAIAPTGTTPFDLTGVLRTVNNLGTVSVTAAASLPAGTATKVALSYDGAFWRVYINGVFKQHVAATGAIVQNWYEEFLLGADTQEWPLTIQDSAGTWQIADFRISNTARYTSEAGGTPYPPETVPLTTDTNTILLFNFGNCGTDNRMPIAGCGLPGGIGPQTIGPYQSPLNVWHKWEGIEGNAALSGVTLSDFGMQSLSDGIFVDSTTLCTVDRIQGGAANRCVTFYGNSYYNRLRDSSATSGLQLYIDQIANISSSTAANPMSVTCDRAHGLTSGQQVDLINLSVLAPREWRQTITVTGATTFTVPVDATGRGAGSGGTVHVPVSCHGWVYGAAAVAGVGDWHNLNVGNAWCWSFMVAGSGGQQLTNASVDESFGLGGIYATSSIVTLISSGPGDEGGRTLWASAQFNNCQRVMWYGDEIANFGGSAASSTLYIDGCGAVNIDAELIAFTNTAHVRGISNPGQIRLLGSSQGGVGFGNPFKPWSDGSVDVIVEPLEVAGRSSFDTLAAGNVTAQWGPMTPATGPDFSCHTLIVTNVGGHTAGNFNLILPTNAVHIRAFKNGTAFTMTVTGPSGATFAIAAGKFAMGEGTGTGWERLTADV